MVVFISVYWDLCCMIRFIFDLYEFIDSQCSADLFNAHQFKYHPFHVLICYYCLKMRCCLCIFLQRRKRKCRGVDQNSVVGYFTSSDTIISLICAIPPSALYWFQVIFDILFVPQSLLRLFACNSPLLSWLDWPSSCNKNQKGGLGSQSREAITSLRRTLDSF